MLQISLREANQHLSQYIEEVNAGKEIIITKRGTPVARLMPIKQKSASLNETQKLAWERLSKSMKQGYALGGMTFDRNLAHER